MNYYEENAEAFIARTVNVDLTALYDRFLPNIPEGGKILDAGCGSGRDAMHFMKLGYDVSAFDASKAMTEHAQRLTGLPVKQMTFADVDWENEFDGVWACASLLHEPPERFSVSIANLMRALKPGGFLFASVKHGSGPTVRDGRQFYDYTEEDMRSALKEVPDIADAQHWITPDHKGIQGMPDWLNVLIRKMN